MKSRTTALWFVLAVSLAAGIWVWNAYFQPGPVGERPLFQGLHPSEITAVQIIPAGAREISAVRTNQTWLLEKPVIYPAQASAIEGLLATLQQLTPTASFSAAEMTGHKDAGAEFGFDNPQYALDMAAGGQTWHLRVGNKTAPGDGVYVQIVGAPGAYVTETTWLQFLPHDAGDWRDTTLMEAPAGLDWLVITNGPQAIELRRDLTNHLWRMVRPLQARADNLRIVTGLQQLRTAKVSRFVTDSTKADLASYGLQPPGLDLWLGKGTNLLNGIHAGKEVTGVTGEIYIRREGWDGIMSVPKDALAPWRGAVIDFRDPNLLEIGAPPAEIDVQGANTFRLERQGSNSWVMEGEKFPVDVDQVIGFVHSLANLQITDYVQDAVTPSGLQSYGLAKPGLQITLHPVGGPTNNVVQLLFGGATTNEIYVKRADEDYVYAVSRDAVGLLPLNGEYFRDRRVWTFSPTNVAAIIMHQSGKTRQLIRSGTNDWSFAPGSQGIISPLAIEETVFRLGQLTVDGWIGRKFNDSDIGLTTNSLSLTVNLKTGEKYEVEFGRSVLDRTAVAVVTLDGERWAFVFPQLLYPLVLESLAIPPDAP